MSTLAKNPVVEILRAGKTYPVRADQFLPSQLPTLVAPSRPEDIQIAHVQTNVSKKIPIHALCIFDTGKIVSEYTINDNYDLTLDDIPLRQFSQLSLGNERFYSPIFRYSFYTAGRFLHVDSLFEVAESHRGKGIARSFFVNLEMILRDCGFRINARASGFPDTTAFFVRGGRRFLEEFIDPSDIEMPLLKEPVDITVKCLYQDDEQTLIRPELVNANLDQRLELLDRVGKVKRLFELMDSDHLTTEFTSTTLKVLDDMQSRGVPLLGNFLDFESDSPGAIAIAQKQCKSLWRHTYKVATLYSTKEIQEFLGWYKDR